MKKFKPRTRGGYEYEIFAERHGRLWGYVRTSDWLPISWNTAGRCSDFPEIIGTSSAPPSDDLSLIPEEPEVIVVEDVCFKKPQGFGQTAALHIVADEKSLESLWGKKGTLKFYVEE